MDADRVEAIEAWAYYCLRFGLDPEEIARRELCFPGLEHTALTRELVLPVREQMRVILDEGMS